MNKPVIYASEIRLERLEKPPRPAFPPMEPEPVFLCANDEIAADNITGLALNSPKDAALDYLVAAAASSLMGTLGSALEASGIPAGEGRLSCQARGEVEKEGEVLVLRRIHVTYRLKLVPEQRPQAVRVHQHHVDSCPIARTIGGCVEITTSLKIEEI